MKTSKVAQLCKASRDIVLVNMDDGGRRPDQWVGTAQTLYPLSGMPTMNKAQIYALLDVTEKQEGKIRYTEKSADKIGFNVREFDDTEEAIEPRGINIVYGGSVLVPFDTSKGIRLVDRAFITAMAKDIDMLMFYERQTAGGTIYIVARKGLLLEGVIMPRYDAGGDIHLAAFAQRFAERMQVARDIAEAQRTEEDTRSGDQQLSLIDKETGELLEPQTDEPEPEEDEPDDHEEPTTAPVALFAEAQKPKKIGIKLRTDNDGGDAA